jgi:imidazole glycerol-phosphate synthase subunit HisF
MSLLRLIARLDIKGQNVVKGIQMEGLRVVGKPADLAKKYAEAGADELLYIDTVATLYGRNQLAQLLEETTNEVFVPITVGGGIKSSADVRNVFNAGADKVALNTAAIRSPRLIAELASAYGSQAIVVSIEAKRTPQGWEAYTDNGRERTGQDAVIWAERAVELGAGEILITSIDQEGTRKGFDLPLIGALKHLPVPVTVSGGMGSLEHLYAAIEAGADAVAMASALHYGHVSFDQMTRMFPVKL